MYIHRLVLPSENVHVLRLEEFSTYSVRRRRLRNSLHICIERSPDAEF